MPTVNRGARKLDPLHRGLVLLCLAAALALLPAPAAAQSGEDCLDCHDETLTTIRDGREVSLHVDLEAYVASIHGDLGMECIDCHDAIDELPHDDELPDVDCTMCHDDIAEIYDASLHGLLVEEGAALAPRCWDCHGAHEIMPPEDPASVVNRFNIPFMCGRCHKEGTPVTQFYAIPQDSILTHYSLSMHGEGLYRRGLTISAICTDCHTAHNVLPHDDPRSSIHRDNVATTCQLCHGRIEEVHTKVIEGELWEAEPHKVPVCIECHEPHKVRRVFYQEGMSNRECLECHGDQDIFAVHAGDTLSLFVDENEFFHSAHRETACIQCHTGVTPTHERPCDTVALKVDCGICHADQVQQFRTGMHGRLLAQGDPDAPDCTACHGTHGTLKRDDPRSPIHVRNVPDLCATCHGPGGAADLRHPETGTNMVENFKHSIHGKALDASGLVVSASCTECHTAHQVLPSSDPLSSISSERITGTCARCHEGIYEDFQTSIHHA
ncbi:MAG: cytochrome c3 family protein, partial [Deltaproteobacteria bacterium]|nr:cytochrome c3 family protein [Deltaproteobacteria bacterium]